VITSVQDLIRFVREGEGGEEEEVVEEGERR